MRFRFTIRDLSPILGSLIASALLIFFDAIVDGTYLFSVFVCPIWFLVGLIRAWRVRYSNPKVALARIAIPVVTLLLILANSSLQGRIAMANATRIIQACDQYRGANGEYPKTLDDLVPRYLNSIPTAKYCLAWSDFSYFGGPQSPILWWVSLPPFGRWGYNFERGSWRYID